MYPAFNENTVFFHKPYYIKIFRITSNSFD